MARVCLAISTLLLAAACAAQPLVTPTPSQPTSRPASNVPATPSPSPTARPTATPAAITLPPASASPTAQLGLPSAGCINGWLVPTEGSPLWREAVDLVQQRILWDVPVQVREMRFFRGPDVAWMVDPRYEVVDRWYVRTGSGPETDMATGRWLVEKRTDEIKGVSAVAGWDTNGYRSPDWTGFVGEGPATTHPGLPGAWSGIPYDFVTGEGDSGNPGLPDEVVDCLAGT